MLKAGELDQVLVRLDFFEPKTKFKLIEGSGPVYILGRHTPEEYLEQLQGELVEEEVEQEYVSINWFFGE